MDGETLVPLNWLFYLGGVLVFCFVWWLRHEFKKNDDQHTRNEKGLVGVHKRIDHLIMHLLPHKPYKGDDNGT